MPFNKLQDFLAGLIGNQAHRLFSPKPHLKLDDLLEKLMGLTGEISALITAREILDSRISDSRAHSQPRVARLHRIGPFAARQTQRAPSSEPARLSAASSTPGPLLAQDRCLACIPRSRIGRRVSPRC